MNLLSFLHDDFATMALRLFIALFLSGLIGLEREVKNHAAGFRTHILVGVASCLMMLLSLYGFIEFMENHENVRFDPARIPSYVISGIGFLGAGTIMVFGVTIRGLTTAASVWTVAGIGLVVGAGMYSAAILTTFIILLSLVLLHRVENYFVKTRTNLHIQLIVTPELRMESLLRILERHELKIGKLEIDKEVNDDRNLYMELKNAKQPLNKHLLFEQITGLEHVRKLSEV